MNRLLLFLSALIFLSCYDDFDLSEEVVIEEDTGTRIISSLNGHILHEVLPGQYFRVELGPYAIDKVSDRFFQTFNDVRKEGEIIRVWQNDKLFAIKRLELSENDIVAAEIPVLPLAQIYQLADARSGSLVFGDGSEIHINNYPSRLDGSAFTSELNIHHRAIDKDAFIEAFGFRASDEDNNTLLFTDIAFAQHIDFKSPDGESLRFAPGRAYLTVDRQGSGHRLFKLQEDSRFIPVRMDDSSRHFITESGFFVYASTTQAKNWCIELNYKGYDLGYGKLLANGRSFNGTARGIYPVTAEDSGNLDLQLINSCGEVLHNWILGPEELDKQTVKLDIDSGAKDHLLFVDAQLIDCNGTEENKSLIGIRSDQENRLLAFPGGDSRFITPVCRDALIISGVNIEDWTRGPEFSWNIEEQASLGFISNCMDVEEGYSYVRIKDEMKLYDAFTLNSQDGKTILSSDDGFFKLRFDGAAVGSYPSAAVNIGINDPSFGVSGYKIDCESSPVGCGIDEFIVSHYPGSGKSSFRVNFSGKIWAQTLDPPVAGNYPIEGTIFIETN